MAQRSLYDLTLNISANSAELKRELDSANTKLDGFEKNAKNLSSKITSALSFVGVGASIAGLFATIKSSMESVEGPGDRLEATITGGKEALFEMQRAIGTMDFSNLINNLVEGYKRGKDFTEAMSELADMQSFSDYKVLALQQEAEILREVIKNKQNELSVRADAAEKIKKIEEDILKRKQEILAESFNIEKQSWEGRNKMTIEEGVKLFETMTDIQKNGYKGVTAETISQIKDLYDSTVEANRIGGSSAAKAMKDAATLIKANLAGYGSYDFIKNIPKEDLNYIVDTFRKFATISETGEADVWKKLFEIINKNAVATTQAQKDFNRALKETSTLLENEEKAQAKVTAGVEKMVEKMVRVAPIDKIDTSNIAIPRVAPAIDSMTLAKPPAEVLQDWQAFTDSLNEIIAQGLQNVVQTMSEGFGALIIEGKGALPKLATSLLGAFANILDQLSAIAFGVALGIKAIKTALKSLNPAVALAAGIALAALSGLVKAGIAKIADKSSSVSSGSNQPSFGNFADGGVVYGETIARVAEYSGARTNPEVIAPLDKLKNLLGNAGGLVEFQIKDDILYGILDRRNRRVSSYA